MHLGYGEMKAKMIKSYPSELKSFFFSLVRGLAKGNTKKVNSGKEKLPFWAPASRNKCQVHSQGNCPLGCSYQSFNKKISEQSMERKLFKI